MSSPTPLESLQSALEGVEDEMETLAAEIETLEATLATTEASLREAREQYASYEVVYNDISSSIELLTPEEVDPEHPEGQEELTPADPTAVDGYDDFVYA